jgi:hypothetical protein
MMSTKRQEKVYSVMFSYIFERENERRLSSRFFLKNPKKVVVHAKKEKTPVPPRLEFEVAISVKNHTLKAIRVLGFINKAIKII